MASIFVQIPSYQDYEIKRTILDCIKKSSGENEIKFGVHITYLDHIPEDISEIKNVNVTYSKAPDNLGVGKARYLANELYNEEDFYLQIDSHCRFKENWDKILINTYQKYYDNGCNPILSAYPSGYSYVNKQEILSEDPKIAVTGFVKDESFPDGSYVLHQIALKNEDGNVFTKSVSASFIFGPGQISKILPNKKMYFWGEEILTAIRLFTHGYDLMLPEEQILWHLYYDHDNPINNMRKLNWEDFPSETATLQQESKKELTRIISDRIVGNQELGNQRTLEQYELYAGVDFINKKFTDDRFIV